MRILVIEDDRFLLEYLARILYRAGYQVRTAVNGALGLACLREAPVDLVITDLMVPVKNGLDTIVELCQEFPLVKILAISGAGGTGPSDLLAAAKVCGAQATLAKPFARAELLAAVSLLLTH